MIGTLRKYVTMVLLSLLALVGGSQNILAMAFCGCTHNLSATECICCELDSHNHIHEHSDGEGVCHIHSTDVDARCLAESHSVTSSSAVVDKTHRSEVVVITLVDMLAVLPQLVYLPSLTETKVQSIVSNSLLVSLYINSCKPLRAPPITI